MTTADVHVRPAAPSDAERIAALQLGAWSEALGALALATLAPSEVASSWRRAITTPPDPRCTVLVAIEGTAIVGFAASAPARSATLAAPGASERGETTEPAAPEPSAPARGEPWTAEVTALEVDPDHRRRGHASRLLAALVDLSREQGAHHVAAWALRHDGPRLLFLTQSGLAEVGMRRTLDVPGRTVEEILMTGALGPR